MFLGPFPAGQYQMVIFYNQVEYFTANQKGRDSQITSTGTLSWPNIVQQEGGAFDKHSGIFTTKIGGLYSFSVSALTLNNGGVKQLSLMLNDDRICYGYNNDENKHNNIGCSAHLMLLPNDKVYIVLNHGDLHDGYYTIFTGALIQPLD